MQTPLRKRLTAIKQLLLSLLLLGGTTALPAQIEMLPNGGFEEVWEDTSQLNHEVRTGWGYTLAYGWDEDPCSKAIYDPSLSASGNVSLMLTPWSGRGKDDFQVKNAAGKLNFSLTAGNLYRVSFWLRAYQGTAYPGGISVGFCRQHPPLQFTNPPTGPFAPESPEHQHGSFIGIEPAFTIPGVLDKTESYVRYEFEYTAKGGERYIYIGNFKLERPEPWKKRKPYGNLRIPADQNKPSPLSRVLLDDVSVIALDEEPEPASVDTTPPSLLINRSMVLDRILFTFNSAELDTGKLSEVDSLIKLLLAYPEIHIQITGHADQEGIPEYNQKLSERRAKSLKDYFVHNGVDSSRIITEGMGEHAPTSNEDAQNRRVEIMLRLPGGVFPKAYFAQKVTENQRPFKLNEPFPIKDNLFDLGGHRLLADGLDQIDSIIEYAYRKTDVCIGINVYTEKVGSERYSHILSQKRAKELRGYLANHGIAVSRIEDVGKGVNPEDSSQGRVEFVLYRCDQSID